MEENFSKDWYLTKNFLDFNKGFALEISSQDIHTERSAKRAVQEIGSYHVSGIACYSVSLLHYSILPYQVVRFIFFIDDY